MNLKSLGIIMTTAASFSWFLWSCHYNQDNNKDSIIQGGIYDGNDPAGGNTGGVLPIWEDFSSGNSGGGGQGETGSADQCDAKDMIQIVFPAPATDIGCSDTDADGNKKWGFYCGGRFPSVGGDSATLYNCNEDHTQFFALTNICHYGCLVNDYKPTNNSNPMMDRCCNPYQDDCSEGAVIKNYSKIIHTEQTKNNYAEYLSKPNCKKGSSGSGGRMMGDRDESGKLLN